MGSAGGKRPSAWEGSQSPHEELEGPAENRRKEAQVHLFKFAQLDGANTRPRPRLLVP